MTVPAIQTPTKSPRTRLIGFVAMGVCAIGYVGGGLALLAGKIDQIDDGVADLIHRILDTHLATDVPGLWIDSYEPDGRSNDRAAPASSLYHLMTAFSELLRLNA